MKNYDFVIRVTRRQVDVIQAALDAYARLKLGQIKQALTGVFDDREFNGTSFDVSCESLRTIVFRTDPDNTPPKNPEGEDGQVAHEIYGVIRHELWKREPDAPKHVVSADRPLQYTHEPFVIFEDVAPDEKYPSDFYSMVLNIIEGAMRGDTDKVEAFARLLADKIEATGNRSTAERFRRAANGDPGVRIIPMESAG